MLLVQRDVFGRVRVCFIGKATDFRSKGAQFKSLPGFLAAFLSKVYSLQTLCSASSNFSPVIGHIQLNYSY
jgi:hypothetical protein